MPDLSEDQFREHLDAWEARLGVKFGNRDITLPSGHRLPVSRTAIDVQDTGHGPSGKFHARIPIESGHIVTMEGFHIGHQPSYRDFLSFNRLLQIPGGGGGRDERGYTFYGPRGSTDVFNTSRRDPKEFYEDIQEIIRSLPRPSDELREHNRQRMTEDLRMFKGPSVMYAGPEDEHGRRQRFYHYNVGTGRLT